MKFTAYIFSLSKLSTLMHVTLCVTERFDQISNVLDFGLIVTPVLPLPLFANNSLVIHSQKTGMLQYTEAQPNRLALFYKDSVIVTCDFWQ